MAALLQMNPAERGRKERNLTNQSARGPITSNKSTRGKKGQDTPDVLISNRVEPCTFKKCPAISII